MRKQCEDEALGEEETARRRDAALLRALSTPHKRQAEMKVGKAKPEARGTGWSPRNRPSGGDIRS